jgi:hypothetical protein
MWGIIAAALDFWLRGRGESILLISGFFYLALSVPGFFLGDPG